MTEDKLIEGCRKERTDAQQALYERYAPKFFGVCMRYLKNREDAEDVLMEGMFKILTNVSKYEGKGSFEGWMRRIIINEALMFLRKRHNFKAMVEISETDLPTAHTAIDQLAEQDILHLLNLLPVGYRTIFNLYAVEGYKHREIGEMLGISINTSKSQLILAKNKLQNLLSQRSRYPDVG